MYGKGGKGKEDDELQFSDLSSQVEQSQEPKQEQVRKSVRTAHGNIAPLGAAKRRDEADQNAKDQEQEADVKTDKFVYAQMADETWTVAYVMKSRKPKNAAKEYYVHYQEYNRRMDRWVERSMIRVGSALTEQEAEEVKKYTQAKEAKQKEKKTVNRRDTTAGANNPSATGAVVQEDKRQTFFNNDEHFGMNQNQVQEHEAMTKFKTIEFIQFGPYRSETWYYSPYPAHCQDIKLLYICQNCLNFWPKENQYNRHVPRCKLKTQPPGDQIYREGKISVFEVDGQQQQVYCENLAYLAKLFLDHKYLKFDTSPFLFYLLTEWEPERQRFNLVGYFSKQKFDFFEQQRAGPSNPKAKLENNLSCILVMPFHQKKGYGKFLVDFSYKLSLIEKRAGTPERPLSDLGHKLYTSYWGFTLINLLLHTSADQLSIADIRDQTGMIDPDIESTLKDLNILQYRSGQWVLISEKESLQAKLKSFGRPSRHIDSSKIRWTPYKK